MAEKAYRDQTREQRENFEEEQEAAKKDLKIQLADKYEKKEKKLELDSKQIKREFDKKRTDY